MDFVIISAVRSLTGSEIISSPPPHWLESHLGSLADERQTNVALTRARHGLIVIGRYKDSFEFLALINHLHEYDISRISRLVRYCAFFRKTK